MKELQMKYARYLRLYCDKRVATQVKRDVIQELIDENGGAKKFEQKWLDIFDDID